MKVMVMIKATADSEAGIMPKQQLLAAMGRFNEELVEAGVMLAGEGLHPTSKGARVRFSGPERLVIDGPFAETKELIAGFWLWRVGSMEEAIEWVKRCPNPHEEECEIEIRPVFEAEDFGEELTPELREQEAAVRARSLGLGAPRYESRGELLIAGLNERYDIETRAKIPAQWCRFVSLIGSVPGQIGRVSYGVSWNSTGDGEFDYLAGVEVSDVDGLPADFTHVRLPARRYAVFTHERHVSALANAIDTIWSKWVPDCELQIASAPCFERYTEEFDGEAGVGGMEIWIPLES